MSFLAPAALAFDDSVTFPPYSLYTRKVGQQNVKIKSHLMDPSHSRSSSSSAAAALISPIHTISGIHAFMSPTHSLGIIIWVDLLSLEMRFRPEKHVGSGGLPYP